MSSCKNCGAPYEDGAKTCAYCGSKIDQNDDSFKIFTDEFKEKVKDFCHNPEFTTEAKDFLDNKLFAILAYIGLLVLVPIFAAKESAYARFHANQGLVLLIISAAYSICVSMVTGILALVSPMLSFLGTLLNLVDIGFIALAIVGIVNAATGKTKELPLIGKIRILK